MIGKIIKGIAGFYYVNISSEYNDDNTPVKGVFECKAKGIFRKDGLKPLVGDNVEIEILDKTNQIGNIIKILDRKNSLIRPAVANIDQALVIFAAAKPTPNLNLLDRFLVSMEYQDVECIICFNKTDVADESFINELEKVYIGCGYKVMFTSTYNNEGIDEVRQILHGKTTVLAGPSGVGKSSLTNILIPKANMETGKISEKIERGKHTTRHSQIFVMNEESYVFDTPGFSSLYVNDIPKEKLMYYFREFDKYNDTCRFQGCMHINEPDCSVKRALLIEEISQSRYENYKLFVEEINSKKKY